MPSITRTQFATLVSVLALASAASAHGETCAMVSADQVNQALPNFQPWVLKSGGTGRCQFEGRFPLEGGSWTSVDLTLTQQFHATAKTASDLMATQRKEFAKAQTVKSIKLHGADPDAFAFDLTREAASSAYGTYLYARTGRAILSTRYLQKPGSDIDEDDRAAIKTLVETAIADTAKPNTAARSTQCPHFDEALIKKLIPGKNVSIQQFGNNSCLAKNEANAIVMFRRVTETSEDSASQATSATNTDCTHEALPTLGQLGRISYNCNGPKKLASVSFHKDDAWYDFTVIPGKEPSAKQRADLIDLASRRYRLDD